MIVMKLVTLLMILSPVNVKMVFIWMDLFVELVLLDVIFVMLLVNVLTVMRMLTSICIKLNVIVIMDIIWLIQYVLTVHLDASTAKKVQVPVPAVTQQSFSLKMEQHVNARMVIS